MFRNHLILLTILITNTFVFSQKIENGIELKSDINQILSAKDIVYYGWDLSCVKIYDYKLIGKEKQLTPKVESILGLLSEKFNPNYLSKKLNKNIISEMDMTKIELSKRDFSDLISFINFEMTIEDVGKIVNSYNVSQNSGIGLVFIPESMNQLDGFSTVFVTFFDIESKNLLWVTKMKAKPDGRRNFPKKWYIGFGDCFVFWYSKFYKKKMKEYNNK